MKKKKYILLLIAPVVVIALLLFKTKLKKDINNLIENLPYQYEDICTEEFLSKLNNYQDNNIIELLNTKKDLYKSFNDGSYYKSSPTHSTFYIYSYDNKGLFLTKDDGYIDCYTVFIEKEGKQIITDLESKIKIRGNSTADLDKKPYNIKFNEKQDLLGFGPAKKWNLLADCLDPTLLRNNTFLNLANTIGLEYTSRCDYVDVYIDRCYLGTYLLTEAVEVGSSRVDLDLDSEDFFVEFELVRVEDGVFYFELGDGIRFALKEPEEPTEEQLDKYQQKLDEFHDVLFSGDWGKVQELIDVDSFSKLYLVNEYAKTIDFGNSSVNFYYKDGKYYAGPVWDFDLSSGNRDPYPYSPYWNTVNGELINYQQYWCREQNPIFKQLFTYKEFNELYKKILRTFDKDLSSIYEKNGYIDSVIDVNIDLFNKNYTTLDKDGAGWVVSNNYGPLEYPPFDTYEENVEYFRDFLKNRHDWLTKSK